MCVCVCVFCVYVCVCVRACNIKGFLTVKSESHRPSYHKHTRPNADMQDDYTIRFIFGPHSNKFIQNRGNKKKLKKIKS